MFAMRISKSEKEKLKCLYRDLGFDLSTAVNMFFRQSLAENGLPFRPKRTEKSEYSNMASTINNVADEK